MRYVKKFFKMFFMTIFICLFILFIVVCIKFYPTYKDYRNEAKNLVENSSKDTFILNETSYIYDDNGNVLAKLKKDTDSTYLSYDEIPKNFINAFVSIEDRTFWENKGYDIKGIVRVCYNAIKSKGDEVHGASTITQQLARLTFLSQEVSLNRKIKEIFISMELTKKYSKEDIITFYCNDVYFANGYYGISAAARGYFNKDVDELSLSQIAYLCAIPNRPSYYDPYVNKENAIDRRNKILKDMLEENYISSNEYNDAINETIEIIKPKTISYSYQTTYAIECAIQYLMKLDNFEFKYHFDNNDEYQSYNENYQEAYEVAKSKLYSGGYKIYTSLNQDIQTNLQTSIDDTLSFNTEVTSNGTLSLQSAGVVIDNKTRKVIAIVGGRSEENNEYGLNRAYQSYRQPGSTMKPLVVYTPALENDYSPSSILQNIDVSSANKLVQQNKQKDINNLTGESMTLRKAVENSKNGCAIYLFNKIGIDIGLEKLEKMHFNNITYKDYNISTALGGLTYGATPVEMCNAYSTIVNNGKFVDTTCITSILNNKNEEIYKEDKEIQIYDENASKQMVDVLQGVVKNGTAKSMKWTSKIPIAGKTGTTNNSKDGWFCGFSPYYTISIWVGYDTPKEVDGLYGGTYPCKIWKNTMEYLLQDKEIVEFEKPDNSTTTSGNETYLPGRSDDEVLSSGYTVGDYRKDYSIVDEVQTIANKIINSNDENEIENLYQQGNEKIDTIYGRNATSKAKSILDSAYNSKKN